MASGTPDWVQVTGGWTPEQIAAVTPIDPPLVMFDDFETTVLKWIDLAGATLSLDSTAASNPDMSPVFNGDKCLKVVPPAGGDGSIERIFPVPEFPRKIGVSVYFTVLDWSTFKASSTSWRPIWLQIALDERLYLFMLAYNHTTDVWSYSVNGGGAFTTLGTKIMYASSPHYVKVVLDMEDKVVKYIIIDGERFLIDDVALGSSASLIGDFFQWKIWSDGAAGEQATYYIDDAKVTYNEPA